MNVIKILIIIAMLSLTGCLGPVKTQPISKYVLNSVPHASQAKARSRGTILVLPPDVQPVINTTQMAYTIKPYQVAYFSQNQWAETPGQMLTPLMVQTLQQTRGFRAVVTPPFAGQANYVLSTQVLQLQQNYIAQTNRLEMVVRAQLARLSTNRVVATHDIVIKQPIHTRSPYAGVLAANLATERMLAELARFTLKHT